MFHHLFAYPLALWLLAALPLLALLGVWARGRRRQALVRLGSAPALRTLLVVGRRWWVLRGLCFGVGLTCLGLGTAGPQWGRDWEESAAPGRDLVVVLDCSRSMYAETPSRLERARAALLDLSQAVRQRGGHRLGLVVFAAQARLACPLTHDYDHFREAVNDIDTSAFDPDLGPGPGAASGTRIGRGLAEALDALAGTPRGTRDVLLLSDGDDPARDGEWREAAREAERQGVPIYTVGIGDSEQGHPIPADGGWLTHDSRQVLTQLQEEPLRQIADQTKGLAWSAGTTTLPLGTLYLDVIAGRPVREDSADILPVYRPRYRWFLWPALVFLALGVACPDRARQSRPAPLHPVPSSLAPVVEASSP